jgi:hypothetical protein
MLDLLTTDEFAEWFASLDDGPAEDVAATLEVITQLGTRTEAPGSSEWLTWYEHPSLYEHLSLSTRLRDSPAHSPPESMMKFLADWDAFNGYVRRVVKHLESPAFVARVGRLLPRDAAIVSDAIARIRKAATSRRLAMSEFARKHPRAVTGTPTPSDRAALDRFADAADIREAYFEALAAAGFAVVDVPAHSPALREIGLLRVPGPGLRLLYGIDTRRNRGLVVLGEWMDRNFYGDSVRRAERLWQRFLDGDLQAAPTAKAR